jgi:orotidine-5'-phosphate decarboxylase
MRAAVEGHGDSPLSLLAMTVLTSFDRQDLDELGYSYGVSELISLLARRAAAGPNAILVTPGVRSAGAGKGDQKRVATPAEALRAGANYVVMGRQITRAEGSGRRGSSRSRRDFRLRVSGFTSGLRLH